MSNSPSSNGDSSTQRPVDFLARYLLEVVGEPVDEPLLLRALTHRSYAYENGGLPNNERLEFLGDSVLGLVVTDSLYRDHPDLAEGQLAKLRAAVVNMRALADVARTLGLGEYLLLGRGEESTGGRDKASILADTMEAVIGTVYLSSGLSAAATFVHHLLDPLMRSSATARRRPRLEDQPAGAHRLGRRSVSRVPRHRGGPGPREGLHRRARSSATRCSARGSVAARRRPSRRPPRSRGPSSTRRANAVLGAPVDPTPPGVEAPDRADA